MNEYYTKKANVGDVVQLSESKGIKLENITEEQFAKVMRNKEHVVVKAQYSYSEKFMGPDEWQGWKVTVKQLKQDGKYNLRGKEIVFFQTGLSSNIIEQVYVVGKMRQTYERTK